jgi:hypothetical protein
MLRPDLIELAILRSLVDWSDSSGRQFGLTKLRGMLTPLVSCASDGEMTDALILLFESGCIAIDQYRGHGFVPYNVSDGAAYFYMDVRCRALPKARKRLHELSGRERSGVFISHIAEE